MHKSALLEWNGRGGPPPEAMFARQHFNTRLPGNVPRTQKAKRICFYRNGDRFYRGVMIAVTARKYGTLENLLADLTRILVNNVFLPGGVRMLFNMDGKKVRDLEDLEDGKCYVCAGPHETFKRVDYAAAQFTVNVRGRYHDLLSNLRTADAPRTPPWRPGQTAGMRPRFITVIRSGMKPRRVIRLLINKRNAPSFEHALSLITEAIKLDAGAVRKLFTEDGQQVTQLEDFYGICHVFIAYGKEKVFRKDFELVPEELKAIVACNRGHGNRRMGAGCSDTENQVIPHIKGSKSKMTGKTNTSKNVQQHAAPYLFRNRYRVGDLIGEGGFAVVRHCIDKLTGTDYALKIVDKSKCSGTEWMIGNEVTILKIVNHPNIIRLIEEHDSHQNQYLVMEFVNGGDLLEVIESAGKFSEKEARLMFHSLASALCYLHSLQIVHRDIKPHNILVDFARDGTRVLKLADFGFAQKVTEALYTSCGTPAFAAPEVLAGKGYGMKIDVWSVGVTLYFVLSGYLPFYSSTDDMKELCYGISRGLYEFSSPYWDDVSESAKDLIQHMLQVDPQLRYSAEDVIKHPWLAEADASEHSSTHGAADYSTQPKDP